MLVAGYPHPMTPEVRSSVRSLMFEFPNVNPLFIVKLVEKHPEYALVNYCQATVTFQKQPAGGYDWMQICIFCGGSEGLEWEDHTLQSPECRMREVHAR